MMYNEIPGEESRLSFKIVAVLAVASAAVYAAVDAYGLVAMTGLAGLTIGYLAARCTKL